MGRKFEGGPDGDVDRAGAGPGIMHGVNFVEALNTNWNNGDTQAYGHHTDAGPEVVNLPVRSPLAFRINKRA
jgi:hypothetical protein